MRIIAVILVAAGIALDGATAALCPRGAAHFLTGGSDGKPVLSRFNAQCGSDCFGTQEQDSILLVVAGNPVVGETGGCHGRRRCRVHNMGGRQPR